MIIIALAGLVISEKIKLARDLARHYQHTGHRVMVLDGVAGLSRPLTSSLPGIALEHVEASIDTALDEVLCSRLYDVVILAVDETTHPEDLAAHLALVEQQHPSAQVITVALIDLRTCDCFPHVRAALEANAGVVVHCPVGLDDVIEMIGRVGT